MSIADKLTTIAENEQKVYDKGVEDGKKSERDAFWDRYQNNGKRTAYNYAFANIGWNDKTFTPKYDLICYSASHMFNSSEITDLAGILAERGLTLDVARSTWATQMFMSSKITHIPPIDIRKMESAESYGYMFYSQSIKTIDKLITADNIAYATTLFGIAYSLKNLTIEGVIGKSLSISASPLTVESAKSVINALKNYAGTDKELTYKLTLKSTVWTALNNAEAPPNGATWKEYVQSLGWQCA